MKSSISAILLTLVISLALKTSLTHEVLGATSMSVLIIVFNVGFPVTAIVHGYFVWWGESRQNKKEADLDDESVSNPMFEDAVFDKGADEDVDDFDSIDDGNNTNE